MYVQVVVKWEEIKDAETFISSYKDYEGRTIIKIERVVVDWDSKMVYETWETFKEGEEIKKHKDDEYVKLLMRKAYGPYGSEASVKTAVSKIKKKIRK